MTTFRFSISVLLVSTCAFGQGTSDPYPRPLGDGQAPIVVSFAEFATLPDIDGVPARIMKLVDEPGTGRLFANDMRGPLYSIDYEGRSVTAYVDTNDARWGVPVESGGREVGMQSFAFHPQFGEAGTPGFGKFYTWSDTSDKTPAPDFVPGDGDDDHDTVLLEWTARTPGAATYDGDGPRVVLRVEQPFWNHNGGFIGFNTVAEPGNADFGLLYIGVGDGGSGGDPFGLAQNRETVHGKVLRLDPLGNNSASGNYGIPASNPFVGDSSAREEIYAYGFRNPQRFAWDTDTGAMYVTDIGHGTVEEVSIVTAGANLGWNTWEGSFRYLDRGSVDASDPRRDAAVTFPVAEFGQEDPAIQARSAVTGLVVSRSAAIPALENVGLFGDLVSGEILAFDLDDPPNGQDGLRRVLLNDNGSPRTALEIVQVTNTRQGREAASRVDLRMSPGPDGQIFLLNKSDGTIRLLVP